MTRKENLRMQKFLAGKGFRVRVKRIHDGSMKGVWRIYGPGQRWTEGLAEVLNKLGFTDFDGKPLGIYSGNGGAFQVFVRGFDEMASPSKNVDL